MAKDALRLFDDLPKEARKRAAKKAQRIVLANRLARLRESCGITQARLAQTMHVKQAAISRLEGREDMKVTTLIRYLEGLGCEHIRILADLNGKRKRIELRGEELERTTRR